MIFRNIIKLLDKFGHCIDAATRAEAYETEQRWLQRSKGLLVSMDDPDVREAVVIVRRRHAPLVKWKAIRLLRLERINQKAEIYQTLLEECDDDLHTCMYAESMTASLGEKQFDRRIKGLIEKRTLILEGMELIRQIKEELK